MPLSGGVVAGILALILGFLLATLSRHLFRDAEPRVLDDPVRPAGQDVGARAAPTDSTSRCRRCSASPLAAEREALRAATRYRHVAVFAAYCRSHRYLRSPLGRLAPAIQDNEIRVEYMGASVRYAIHVNYVIAAVLAGVGGGAGRASSSATSIRRWRTGRHRANSSSSPILSGTGSVVAPFLGSLVFEWIKSIAYEYAPYTWQMVLGIALLLVIVFLPAGLWSCSRAAHQDSVTMASDPRRQGLNKTLRRGDRGERHRCRRSRRTRSSA